MKSIRFIHAADLHLDSPFQGLSQLPDAIFQKVRESTFTAFDKIINYAIEYNVDFVLLCGDLFDNEYRSLKAQWKLKKGLEELHKHHIRCFIIHGNHDHLGGEYSTIQWPNNTYVFGPEVQCYSFSKNNIETAIYGFSYPTRSVFENISIHYNKTIDADFSIGMLHGTADGRQGHDPYAPFSVQQLKEKQFDYWALGHIHKREKISQQPPIVYSGNIQGRHIGETGEKGVYLVEINERKQSTMTFLHTATFTWEHATISIDEFTTIDELKTACEALLDSLRKESKGCFLSLTFSGSGILHDELHEWMDDLISSLNEEEQANSSFVIIVNNTLMTTGNWSRDQLKKQEHLAKDIVSVVEQLEADPTVLEGILDEIFSHSKIKKYVPRLTNEDQRQLLLEAENYILASLLKERNV